MRDLDRLRQAFHMDELAPPGLDRANLVDLGRAIARVAEAPVGELSPRARELADEIGENRHLILVVVDGLGFDLLQLLDESSFLRRGLCSRISVPFPSTTAVGITALVTGSWPADHAVTSWYTHVPSINDTATILPFVRRSDETSLRQLGVRAEEAFPTPVIDFAASRDSFFILPKGIVDSAYSAYISGRSRRAGYPAKHLNRAVEAVMDHIGESRRPTFCHVYTSLLDAAAHETGTRDPGVQTHLRQIDAAMEALARQLPRDATLVVTADHGHRDVRSEAVYFVEPEDELCESFSAPPSGDARVMFFHLKADGLSAFESAFRRRFGDAFYLLSTGEVEALKLLGPGAISAETRRRVGAYTAISKGDEVIWYARRDEGFPLRSAHSGLTWEEMEVPLVIV